MRTSILAALAAVPLLLVGWVVHQGRHPPPPEKPPETSAARKPAPTGDEALLALFSGPLGGAKVKDKVALYDSQSLFDYIDGGAPPFLETGFRKLAAAEMVSADGADFVCDVYDMGSPESSTAMFHKERSPDAKAVEGWPAAIAGSLSFVFHAGPYYVKLTAFDARGEAALPPLARALREKGATPPQVVAAPAP